MQGLKNFIEKGEFYIRLYELPEDIPVFCPVYKASVKVTSPDVQETTILTKFILHAVNRGRGVDTVAKITQFDKEIIQEDFNYLLNLKILSKNHKGKFELTENGYKTYQYIKAIEDFNEANPEVLINTFSREITKDFSDLYKSDEIDENALKLPKNIVTELYFNINPENLFNIMKDSRHLKNIKDSDKENLEFSLHINWDIYYKKMNITHIPQGIDDVPFHKLMKSGQSFIDKESSEDDVPILSIKRYFSMFKLYFEIKDNENLSRLKNLYDKFQDSREGFDERSIEYVEKYISYLDLSKMTFYLYLDEMTGEIGFRKVIIEDESSSIRDLPLEPNYNLQDISLKDKEKIVDKIHKTKYFDDIDKEQIKPIYKKVDRASKIFDYPIDNIIGYYIDGKDRGGWNA